MTSRHERKLPGVLTRVVRSLTDPSGRVHVVEVPVYGPPTAETILLDLRHNPRRRLKIRLPEVADEAPVAREEP